MSIDAVVARIDHALQRARPAVGGRRDDEPQQVQAMTNMTNSLLGRSLGRRRRRRDDRPPVGFVPGVVRDRAASKRAL